MATLSREECNRRAANLAFEISGLVVIGSGLYEHAKIIQAIKGDPTASDYELGASDVDLGLPVDEWPASLREIRQAVSDNPHVDRPRSVSLTEPKAWAWFLREVRGGLVDWWQVWDDGARALDELPRVLVDDRTKPAKDRWSSQLRRLWRELHRWVQETRVSFKNQAYEVNLAAFVRAVREDGIPAGWLSKVASLGTFLRDLDAVQDNLGNCPYVKKPKPAQGKATTNDAAPAQAVGLGVTIQTTAVGAAEPKEPRRPVCESRAVKLFGLGEQPEVNGKRKPTLTPARYDAVKALIGAGETGLTKDELDRKSKHGDARKTLKRLAGTDRDWQEVISFPGTTGKRYRIR